MNRQFLAPGVCSFTLTVIAAVNGCAAFNPEDPDHIGTNGAVETETATATVALSVTAEPVATQDQVAESIRRSYTRTRAGQTEELVANVSAGSSAASKAKPVGVMYDPASGSYRFWLYTYQQTLAGVSVQGSELKVLVANLKGNPPVWVSSSLRDLASFTVKPSAGPRAVDVNKSQRALSSTSVAAMAATSKQPTVSRFSDPEPIIYAGKGDQALAPRLANRYFGLGETSAWLFISDAETGEILHTHNLAAHANVAGTVTAMATPNDVAEYCAAPVSMPLPYAQVDIAGGSSALTNALGQFTLVNPGTSAVTVTSAVTGNYFTVNEKQNSPPQTELLSLLVTPPGPASFVHNADLYGYDRSEVNAYIGANKVRDWVLKYDPAFPAIGGETNFPLNVNIPPMSCQNIAYYMHIGSVIPPEINFCVSTTWGFPDGTAVFMASGAFGDLIYHEYTHHLIDMAHPAWDNDTGAYGEGMGDAVGNLIAGRPEHGLGIDINSNCTAFERTANNTCQYSATDCSSCGSEIHACGNLLSGIIWSIREQLKATHPTDYQDIVNRLVINSIKVRANPTIDQSLLDEFLTLDDNDGNPLNGTPHRSEICTGFAAHGIQCAPLPGPCAAFCNNPLRFTWNGSYQSGNLGTGAICRETTHAVMGGNCGNLAGTRKLFVNGRQMTCNGQNWTNLPPPAAGGYCVTTTAGNQPWAFFTLW